MSNIVIMRAPPCNLLILRAYNGCCTKTQTWNKELGRWLPLDYNAGKWFKFELYPIEDIRSLGTLVDAKRGDPTLMIVRGEPSAIARDMMAKPGWVICRKLSGPSVEGTLDDVPRSWLMTDIDKFPCTRLELIDHPEAVVQRAIETMLPPEFHDVTCFYQFSASAGFRDGIAGIHIWWWLDRPVDSPTIKRWLEDKTKPTRFGDCKVDCSILSGNIPHYFSDPVINGGHEPLPRRTGFLEGEAEFVTLPTDLVIVKPRAAISLQWNGPADLQREYLKLKSALEFIPDFNDIEREERIKIGHAIKAQLGEAGRDLWLTWASSGPNAAAKWNGFQPNRVTGATIYRLARDAGWAPPSDLATPAEPEVVAPPMPLPTGTAKEAASRLTVAIDDWIVRNAGTADRRLTAIIAQASGATTLGIPEGETALAMAGLGIGKTAAAQLGAGRYLAAPTPDRPVPRRIICHVPDHTLAEDAAARFRAMFPNTPCQIHLGIERPDPDAPGFDDPEIPDEKKIPMCRRLADAKEVIAAGGDISAICGSEKRGYCPHHPDRPGATPETICGRMKARTIKSGLLILAGPESLSQAPPKSFGRHVNVETANHEKKRAHLPPADILLTDEPRFHSLLGGCGEKAYDVTIVEMQAPLHRFPGDPARADDKVDSQCAEHALHSLARVLSALPLGPLKAPVVRQLAKTHDWSTVRKAILRFKAEPDAFIKPNMRGKELHDTLKKLKAHNGRLFHLARLTHVLLDAADALSGCPDNAESGLIDRIAVVLGNVEVPAVRLRWVNPVHKAWSGIPTLLLDGTADPEVARRWFPNLAIIADATAATPDCVSRVQAHDKAFSYLAWAPKGEEPPAADDKSTAAKQQRTAWNNIERLGRLLTVRCAQYRGQGRDGIDVLAAMPQRTEKALSYWFNRHGGMPAGLAIRHFNKLRGQDGFGGVRCLMIVSRPQPPTYELERIAWSLSGVRGNPVPNGKLPEVPAAYLMADGTGRQATTVRHPDAWAERVRVAFCDIEVVQAEARARAVRRTPDQPLQVEILTNVPLPIPINRLITADEALADSHPARWLVAAGVVPVLGANGSRQFLGAVLCMDPNAVRVMLTRDPVWSEVLGAAHRAQTPYEKSHIANVHGELWHVRLEIGDRYAVPVLIGAATEDEAHRRLATVGVTPAEIRKAGADARAPEPQPPAAGEERPMVEAQGLASIGAISAAGMATAVIEATAVASIGRIGAAAVMEHADPVETLAQQLLAAAEANPAIKFTSHDKAVAYYRSAARSELARQAKAARKQEEWEDQIEVLRYRNEQARRSEAEKGLDFDTWWAGLGAAAA